MGPLRPNVGPLKNPKWYYLDPNWCHLDPNWDHLYPKGDHVDPKWDYFNYYFKCPTWGCNHCQRKGKYNQHFARVALFHLSFSTCSHTFFLAEVQKTMLKQPSRVPCLGLYHRRNKEAAPRCGQGPVTPYRVDKILRRVILRSILRVSKARLTL